VAHWGRFTADPGLLLARSACAAACHRWMPNSSRAGPARPSASASSRAVSLWAVRLGPQLPQQPGVRKPRPAHRPSVPSRPSAVATQALAEPVLHPRLRRPGRPRHLPLPASRGLSGPQPEPGGGTRRRQDRRPGPVVVTWDSSGGFLWMVLWAVTCG
jgi:hypothetical protein